MQRIHLGDDRLAPERVRSRKEQSGRRRRRHRAAELHADQDDDGARERRLPRPTPGSAHAPGCLPRSSGRRCRWRCRGDSRRAASAGPCRFAPGTTACLPGPCRAAASRGTGRTRRCRRRRRPAGRIGGAPRRQPLRLAAIIARISASGRVFTTCRRSDPAAPRRRDAELHLHVEQFRAVAVAVDRHHARRRQSPVATGRRRGRGGPATRRFPRSCRVSTAIAKSAS